MTTELTLLLGTAATVGVLHTLLGPDHYLPFVAMSRALHWSRAKTAVVTLACGVGHVLSSVVLGMLGIALGVAATRLRAWESYRGELATWFLIAFGLIYFAWGLRFAAQRRPHFHAHVHEDGRMHAHQHDHEHDHMHVHVDNAGAESPAMVRATPWVLFTIFIFGPCEPLIPLLMYPAAQSSLTGVVLVVLVFGIATLATMLAAVTLLAAGAARFSTGSLERHMHALAGAALLLCGVAMRFLSL